MTSWDEIRGKIKHAYDEIESAYKEYVEPGVGKVKERPILNTVVKMSLSLIPIIGPNLRDLYDNIGGGAKSEEDKAKQILEFLGSLERQNKEEFDRIAEDLEVNRQAIIDAVNRNDMEITALISKSWKEIVEAIQSVKDDTRVIKDDTGVIRRIVEKEHNAEARITYEFEARRRFYSECGPILLKLKELSEDAHMRISHMPLRIKQKHFVSRDAHLKEKDSMAGSEEEPFTWQERKKEEFLKKKLGWLSFPNYYMLSTIYQLFAPMAAFRLLQDRLTTDDLELDPFIKTIYLLSKHLYRTFSSDTELADIANIPYETYDQGIYARHLDSATEALIEHYGKPRKGPPIKEYGEFEKQYVIRDNSVRINGKKVEPPFDRIYEILEFFHPRTKPIFWRILIEQLYLYNAMTEVFNIRVNTNYSNYQDAFVELLKNKPIKHLHEEQLNDFKGIPNDQLNDLDPPDQWFRDVEEHLSRQEELKKLMEF